jgi:hypothetical protein
MIPKLPASVKTKLYQIIPSRDGQMRYYPCRVQLRDGRSVDHVYVTPIVPYLEHWGILPADDPGKSEILAGDVVDLEESAHRLPVALANTLYAAGESGMGYCSFEMTFSDATRQRYVTGGAVDFLPLPPGKTWTEVTDIRPHVRDETPSLAGLPYSWCLFDPSPAA